VEDLYVNQGRSASLRRPASAERRPAAASRGAEPSQRFAVVDIGSNSVRLVVFERVSRAPFVQFNEKVLCGLGRAVRSTGRLADDSVAKALASIARFRCLCTQMRVKEARVVATAAAREAENGPEFLARVHEIMGVRPELLSGEREAELSALGVICGLHEPDGVAGDLGGGSLELVSLSKGEAASGESLRLGSLSLVDEAGGSLKKAERIVREALEGCKVMRHVKGRPFYAVGGTFRALARLHIGQRAYPLHVMHGYAIPVRDAVEFVKLVERVNAETLDSIASVNIARRPLLAYGALVLDEIIRIGKPKEVVISATGVREGLIYEQLPEEERRSDPLIVAAQELNEARARDPDHAADLISWSDAFFTTLPFDETRAEARLRHAACLLSDISWRAHPDYRGEQALNTIAHAPLFGIDHQSRAYLALTVYFRHAGFPADARGTPNIRELASARGLDRARVLGAAFRVASLIAAGMSGVLGGTALSLEGGRLVLVLPAALSALAGERLMSRMKTLGRLLGREPLLRVLPG
jgi:exopolyphosphatase/guanosine-5'-triphosphate,3'-diphosphate pyrophosphatase